MGVIFLKKEPMQTNMHPKPYQMKEILLQKITDRGGFVNCHAHFDKAFYITEEGLDKSMLDMEVKWKMSDDIKKQSSQADIEARIRIGLDILIAQGCKQTVTFVDAYDAVDHRAIDAANVVKEEYKDKITLLTITQPLAGLIDETARKLYTEITAKADIAGGLPSKDRPNDKENFEWLFKIAQDLDKPLQIHIDQENNPDERDTEVTLEYVKKYNYQHRTTIIHGISLAAQPKEYRQQMYDRMAKLDVALVVCPSAALGMRQLDDKNSPIHNSIANVPEALAAGVTVGLGVDNVYDFYQPFVDGDMYTEIRMLMEACRFYTIDTLADICSTNGKQICNRR